MKRPSARTVKGFRDVLSSDLQLKQAMIDKVRHVYESYGFVPLETPALEYVDALGKFLPESHTPEGGIFSLRNPDASEKLKETHPDYWIGLRYDLTAPLARAYAQHRNDLALPLRRYQVGPVWRYEKPGPGRFREFWQFDFDTVGIDNIAVDAEAVAIMCEVFAALGFQQGDYVVKVNHRKVMQGALEACGLSNLDINDEDSDAAGVLRTVDKLDRLGMDGVRELLGPGRKDPTGDFTEGCGLDEKQIAVIESFLNARADTRAATCDALAEVIGDSEIGREGVEELREMDRILTTLGIDEDQASFDPTIIRGLAYYTGPVFEGQITIEIIGDKGKPIQFGTVYGGGRYDSLIKRFTGAAVPATGASVGVDRLLEAMKLLEKKPRPFATSQVLVTTMDKARLTEYFAVAKRIRAAGIPCEVHLGMTNIRKQLKYADRTGIKLALIAGEDEFSNGEWQIKNLELGREMAKDIETREEWTKDRVAQENVSDATLEARIKELLKDWE